MHAGYKTGTAVAWRQATRKWPRQLRSRFCRIDTGLVVVVVVVVVLVMVAVWVGSGSCRGSGSGSTSSSGNIAVPEGAVLRFFLFPHGDVS